MCDFKAAIFLRIGYIKRWLIVLCTLRAAGMLLATFKGSEMYLNVLQWSCIEIVFLYSLFTFWTSCYGVKLHSLSNYFLYTIKLETPKNFCRNNVIIFFITEKKGHIFDKIINSYFFILHCYISQEPLKKKNFCKE